MVLKKLTPSRVFWKCVYFGTARSCLDGQTSFIWQYLTMIFRIIFPKECSAAAMNWWEKPISTSNSHVKDISKSLKQTLTFCMKFCVSWHWKDIFIIIACVILRVHINTAKSNLKRWFACPQTGHLIFGLLCRVISDAGSFKWASKYYFWHRATKESN